MRLDDIKPNEKNIRVQCLGQTYAPTEEAVQCMNEVSQLRRQWHAEDETKLDTRALVFLLNENKVINTNAPPKVVFSILSGFTLIDAPPETPTQRLNRFKHELNKSPAEQALMFSGALASATARKVEGFLHF